MIVGVHGVGWTSPGFADAAAWAAGQPGEAACPREVIPLAHRRRATLLARLAADVLEQALGPGGLADVPIVFGSVGGELDQTFHNLDLLVQTPPSSSPLRFGSSVHNAALGHLSIPAGNTRFASALAARPEAIVPMVLLEAMAWRATHGGRVAVVWAEEPWPGVPFPPLAAALVLGEPGGRGLLSALRRSGAADPGVDAALGDQPCGRVGGLVRALAGGAADVALGDGWEVRWTPP